MTVLFFQFNECKWCDRFRSLKIWKVLGCKFVKYSYKLGMRNMDYVHGPCRSRLSKELTVNI